ncbi:integrating conjugative element protein [Erwinia amylovora]|uniref:integrating conjugative element protein n=1 Tax=Erwinia TaxID=551 RepID=UPI000196158E|nr:MULTISPECIES: integrating conjugative element protein [Erwinia]AUX71589.1 integrating conjugative element protein [Erwinia pyrifoliae]MCA8878187.1 integrating conjugative element protein [Erwinia pyrifoliae]UDJ86316.1 integrating conjugative element protein [Erwinia amylovora]UDJ97776.1 integrating conjugative element protein [Erwinia amylovora]UDK90165.1 integrating conjugative element protein [Erwinia amylovora]
MNRYLLMTGIWLAASSLPAAAVDASLSSSGGSVSGAVSDGLFYSIGGGSVTSPPPSRSNMSRLGLNGGWSSDLMCGNFDLKTTVGNQLNGITSGFKDLMGNVIQGATGAVMSMPAMAIQRANPGLYEMLTNGVLQAGINFDKGQLNCQNMSKKLADYTMGSKWQQAAVSEEYKDIVAGSGGDAVSSDQKLQKATGEEGVTWVGGEKRGGKGQRAIQPTRDLAKAGYNMMNGLPVTSNNSVAAASCNGSACQRYKTSDEASAAVVKVLGDRSIRTCRETSECASGGSENQPGSTIAGSGFSPLLEDATKENLEQLGKLVNGQLPPTADNLAGIRTGSLVVTRGVIQALRDDQDKAALVQRLAGELAMADTVETALTMRRMLTTGQSEPNAAGQTEAIAEGDRRIDALDREIAALRNEMELRKSISSNSLLTTLERQGARNQDNRLQQTSGSEDQGFGRMGQTQPTGAN